MLEEALTVPGNLHGAFSRFHQYSTGNCILLSMQGAEGPVATYKRWQQLGRQVVRGAKAMEIIRPITVRKQAENDGDEPETFTRFKLVKCIFDYKDTKGDELPPVEVPQWSIDAALEKLDIKRVPFEELNGNVGGYSFDRNIAINPVVPYQLKAELHETAHIVSGHTTKENAKEYSAHRGIFEFEAETPAYILSHELGVSTPEQDDVSRAYIQIWMKSLRPPGTSIRKVFKTADAIYQAGRLAIAGEEAVA